MSEGDDMGSCPKCGSFMTVAEGRMICSNTACPYDGYDLPKRVLSHSEALQKYEYLLGKCKEFINGELDFSAFEQVIENE